MNLKDKVLQMIQQGGTTSPEFQTLLGEVLEECQKNAVKELTPQQSEQLLEEIKNVCQKFPSGPPELGMLGLLGMLIMQERKDIMYCVLHNVMQMLIDEKPSGEEEVSFNEWRLSLFYLYVIFMLWHPKISINYLIRVNG